MQAPRIALIHAVHAAMAPIEQALRTHWPEVVRFNLLDDGLAAALEAEGGQTPAIRERIARLAVHAQATGVAGILYTCSAFGEAIDAVAAGSAMPVLKPNAPMFEAAVHAGRRVGMLATFAPAVVSMEDEFRALAGPGGATLETVWVPGAMDAARRGDIAAHDALVAAAAPQLAHCDVVMLAHFSTATALAAVQAVLDQPVLTAPGAAVEALRTRLQPTG